MSHSQASSILTIQLDYNDSDWISIVSDSVTGVGCSITPVSDPNSWGASVAISGPGPAVIQWLLNSGYCATYGEFSFGIFQNIMSTAVYS